MRSRLLNCKLVRSGISVTFLSAVSLAFEPLADAQQFDLVPASLPATSTTGAKVAAGTILPVILRTSFSFQNSKPGEILRGQIAQTVPLPDGSKIRRGTRVEGHIVSVNPASSGNPAKIWLQFDKLYLEGQTISVVTNLRAIAGFMDVQDAQVPTETPMEGSPYDWLVTRQIGGDSVYGLDGPVMSARDTSKVIGKSVSDGVLVQVSSRAGTRCRGAVEGNDHPQAMWVFSGDACGTYGLESLRIAHSGRTDPKGTIVLTSESPKFKLRNGDGLLLRVD
jgi:hypothetical protein